MEINSVSSLKTRKSSGLLIIPFWKGKKHAEAAVDMGDLKTLVQGPIDAHDFQGNAGEISLIYVSGQSEKRIALLGLGEVADITVEKLRRAYANVTKACSSKKIIEISLLLPECTSLVREDIVTGVMEGLLLPNYKFTTLKHETLKKDSPTVIEKVTLIGAGKAELAIAKKCTTICESVNMVRDLVNGNADDVTPQYLVAVAHGLEKTCKHIKTTVFDKKRIEKEKMGLLLAVNRGSFRDPAFIIVEYKGNPKSNDRTIIVGKGITYDTGGLNLKPTGGMETMKCDMAGAATVLGVVHAASMLNLKVNVIAIVAATENSICSTSYKPGDVYKAYSGMTVEIGNTDAEGRLVLADALSYANDKFKPSRIIDIATLTGAVDIALGNEATGLMSNHDALADLLIHSGYETGERLWRLPLYEDYKESLKSDIADIRNVGGRSAGCIKAAIFLQQFIGNTPWAHLDIASTAFLDDAKRYQPKHATGVGVRLILSLLEKL